MPARGIIGALARPAQRIVSLAPSLTENLLFLGLQPKVVGVTEHCELPPEAARTVKIGSFSEPDIKRIRELEADLVLGLDRFHNRFAGELGAAGIAMMLFNYLTVEDIFTSMDEIIRGVGAEQAGAPLVQGLRDRVSRVQSAAGNGGPRVFRLMTDDPIVTPANSCFQTDAMKLAGGRTMELDFTESYVSVTMEEVVDFDPQVILSCGIEEDQQPKAQCYGCRAATRLCLRKVGSVAARTGWSGTSAAKEGGIHAISCGLLCRPGPRTVEAIELMAETFRQSGGAKTGCRGGAR